MSRNRAYTRAQMERRKAMVRRMVKEAWGYPLDSGYLQPGWVGRMAHMRGYCSCFGCTHHQQGWPGLPRLEIVRAEIAYQQALNDMGQP